MSVHLYTKPNCVQCTATKRVLDREDIPYHTVNLPDNPDSFEFVTKELGYAQAPVIVLDGGLMVSDRDGQAITHWSGFRPDLLNQLDGLDK